MKQLYLTQGKFALVDDADYQQLSQWKWYALRRDNRFHAVRMQGSLLGRKPIYMHVQIMNPPPGMTVDHINGDGLDNRRENLRICTQAENNRNVTKHRTNKSGVKGVYWSKAANKWVAQITVNGKAKYLGLFIDKAEATRAYNDAAREHYGEFARLNTP